MAEERYGGCPCLYIEPCSDGCTCVNSASSRGCSRCCTYGSLKQRELAAVRLTMGNSVADAVKLAQSIAAMNREGDAAVIESQREYTDGIIRRMQAAEADLAAALTKLREIAEGSAWENPQQAAQRFMDELR